MTASAKRLVMLFGLSADPPTGLGGHAGMVRWAAQAQVVGLGRVDEVWVLPVYRHAFESKLDMTRFEHRFRMAQLAFESLEGIEGRVRVLDIERRLALARPDELVGTIDVVRALCAEHPSVQFALLLGADTHRDLLAGRWKESEALRSLVPVVVVPRKGVSHTPEDAAPDAPELDEISSTVVRGSTDIAFLERVLQPAVLDYIQTHRLYGFRASRPK